MNLYSDGRKSCKSLFYFCFFSSILQVTAIYLFITFYSLNWTTLVKFYTKDFFQFSHQPRTSSFSWIFSFFHCLKSSFPLSIMTAILQTVFIISVDRVRFYYLHKWKQSQLTVLCFECSTGVKHMKIKLPQQSTKIVLLYHIIKMNNSSKIIF